MSKTKQILKNEEEVIKLVNGAYKPFNDEELLFAVWNEDDNFVFIYTTMGYSSIWKYTYIMNEENEWELLKIKLLTEME